MWELDYKESWVQKNWCFWTVVLEKTLESPLDCKIQQVHPEGNQSWSFIGSTDAEAPILWPSDAKNWLIRKDPDSGKDCRRENKGTTEDEMVMAFLTRWTWVWASSRSWWWTGRHGLLQSMRLQKVRHDWETQLNWRFPLCVFLCQFNTVFKLSPFARPVCNLWTVPAAWSSWIQMNRWDSQEDSSADFSWHE